MDLKGKRILVLSPETSSASWIEKIQAAGGEAIPFSTIEIESIAPKQSALDEGIKLLSQCDWVIALSQQAIHYLPSNWRLILKQRQCHITAIGPATDAALHAADIATTISFPAGSTSETILETALFQANQIQGRSIVLLAGEGGRTTLVDGLTQRGAIVHKLQTYRRVLPIKPKLTLERLLILEINTICVTSGEALENLLLLTELNAHNFLKSQFVLVLSDRLKTHSMQMGFEAEKINIFTFDSLAG